MRGPPRPRGSSGRAITRGLPARLVFTPQGGETVEIRTPIPASARAGTAARDLAAALTHAIGPDYAVTVSDAGRISIAYGKKERPFRVKLAAEPPPGLSVRFD